MFTHLLLSLFFGLAASQYCDTNGRNATCNTGGFCSCEAANNTCNQIFAGCGAYSIENDLFFEFAPVNESTYTFTVGQTLSEASGGIAMFFVNSPSVFSACVSPPLPDGLFIGNNVKTSHGTWLLGTPTEVVPLRNYTIILKDGNHLHRGYLAFSVQPAQCGSSGSSSSGSGSTSTSTSTSTSGSSNTCTINGQQQCASSTTFQTCSYNAQIQLVWGSTQSCAAGTSCHNSGNSIACN